MRCERKQSKSPRSKLWLGNNDREEETTPPEVAEAKRGGELLYSASRGRLYATGVLIKETTVNPSNVRPLLTRNLGGR